MTLTFDELRDAKIDHIVQGNPAPTLDELGSELLPMCVSLGAAIDMICHAKKCDTGYGEARHEMNKALGDLVCLLDDISFHQGQDLGKAVRESLERIG